MIRFASFEPDVVIILLLVFPIAHSNKIRDGVTRIQL